MNAVQFVVAMLVGFVIGCLAGWRGILFGAVAIAAAAWLRSRWGAK